MGGGILMDLVRLPRMKQVRSALNLHRRVGASSARTVKAAEKTLEATGRLRLRGVLPFLGPAFIAAIAYIDPGNFATNIQAGAQFGYLLLWVILASNLMAILLQTLSAKLGIATGKNLPQL